MHIASQHSILPVRKSPIIKGHYQVIDRSVSYVGARSAIFGVARDRAGWTAERAHFK